MRWTDLAVRTARAGIVGASAALVAMLAFSILADVGDEVARASVAADDPNPYEVPLVPIGAYTGVALGIAALSWPAPRRPAWFWTAVAVRAIAVAALVGYLTSRLGRLVDAVEPVLAWTLAALAFAAAPLLAWESRPRPAAPREGGPRQNLPPQPPPTRSRSAARRP